MRKRVSRGYRRAVSVEDSPETAWTELRATRWDPPGAAAVSADRRRTYMFALGQAEQMFRTAAVVGQATRPLLVFYGLNQAGRAIAAAASEGCRQPVAAGGSRDRV
jgi:hypothetical protein